jgi:hypothetical protein
MLLKDCRGLRRILRRLAEAAAAVLPRDCREQEGRHEQRSHHQHLVCPRTRHSALDGFIGDSHPERRPRADETIRDSTIRRCDRDAIEPQLGRGQPALQPIRPVSLEDSRAQPVFVITKS